MSKKSKIVIARIMAILMVLSILPADYLSAASVVMAEELEENAAEGAVLDDAGTLDNIDGPVSVGGIHADVLDSEDTSNGDTNVTNEENQNGADNSGIIADEPQQSEEPVDDSGKSDGDTEAPAEDAGEADPSNEELTEAKTYIFDPDTIEEEATGEFTEPKSFGTNNYFSVMGASGKAAGVTEFASIKSNVTEKSEDGKTTNTVKENYECYKGLDWSSYPEKLGGSSTENKDRAQAIKITGGSIPKDANIQNCVKITTTYANAKLVMYSTPKWGKSVTIQVKQLDSQNKLTSVKYTGNPNTNYPDVATPKVVKDEFTIAEPGDYYIGFSANGGVIFYMEVTEDPNAKDVTPPAETPSGVTLTFDEPIVKATAAGELSFIAKEDEEKTPEEAETVAAKNVHIKAETLTDDRIDQAVKTAAEAEGAKIMASSSNKVDSAVISYYDFSLINSDDDKELQLNEGAISIKLPYPEKVRMMSEIVVLHETEPIDIIAKDSEGFWIKAESFSPYTVIAEPRAVAADGEVDVYEAAGYTEGAYAEWYPYTGKTISGYMVAVSTKEDSDYKWIDDELIRNYGTYYRADALGLTPGTWYMKVCAVVVGADKVATPVAEKVEKVTVTAHDRSGYAWVNGTSSGAYKEDGSLRDDARVLYITESTKDTVELEVITNVSKDTRVTGVGLQAILNLYNKNTDTRPLDIRLIGNITDFATMDKGDILISGSSATEGKRLHVGITFEGVGEDAVANGWGLRVKNSSNVEIRNIAFMNCDSDEGDDIGLQQDNDHIWVHNCDLFYGGPGGDADQAKGDGALDCKKSKYVTMSYNHFWDTGKSCLLGNNGGENLSNYITYHHNWFDHSDSRHPRVRTHTVHVYNNYYDGNSKYGVGAAQGPAALFVENNYFRNCKYPMLISYQGSDVWDGTKNDYKGDTPTFSGEDGSMIKAFGNIMVGQKRFIPYSATDDESTSWDERVDFDAYVATEKDEKVPESVVTYKGGHNYSNFDTSENFYKNYKLDDAKDVPMVVMNGAGRVNGGDLKHEFNDPGDDESHVINPVLKKKCTGYTTSLESVGGLNGQTVNIKYTVTFDPDNGEETKDVEVDGGKPVADPGAPSIVPEGKTFAGWYKNGVSKWNFSTNVTSNMTLIAVWLAPGEEPPVSGGGDDSDDDDTGDDSGNGGGDANPSDYVHNFTVSGKTSSVYDISGNLATNKGSTEYKGLTLTQCLKMETNVTSISFTAPSDGTLILVFGKTESGKKVKINNVNQTTGTNGILEYSVEAGAILITKGDAINLFYMEYIPDNSGDEEYTITIDYDGGKTQDGDEGPKYITVNAGGTIAENQMPTLTKSDYTFDGWVYGTTPTKITTWPFTPTGTMTIKANWVKDTSGGGDETTKYTITIDYAGGKDQDGNAGPKTITVNAGGTIAETDMPTLTKSDYIFDGWVYGDTTPTKITTWPFTPTANMTIKATWVKDTSGGGDETTKYTIIIDYNGGKTQDGNEGPKTITVNAGGTIASSEMPTLTRSGYIFDGWVYGTTPTKITTWPFTPTGNMTIKATWKNPDGSDEHDGLSGIKIENLKKRQLYTGAAIIPTFDVVDWNVDAGYAYDGCGKLLVAGVDYTVKYKDNKKITTGDKKAQIIITCKGNYKGKPEINERFEIIAPPAEEMPEEVLNNLVDLKGAKITKIDTTDLTYNGKAKYPAFTLKLKNGEPVEYSYDEATPGYIRYYAITEEGVKEELHAKVALSNNINKGTATLLLTGAKDAKGKETTVKKTFKIAAVDLSKNSEKVDVVVNNNEAVPYAVKGAVPETVTVTFNGEKLRPNKDYTVKYSSNKKVGVKGKVTITGKGNYTKKAAIKEFDITKLDLSDLEVSAVTAYTGMKAGKVKATVVDAKGNALKASQYTVHVYESATAEETYAANTKLEGDIRTIYVEVKAKDTTNLVAESKTPRTAFAVGNNIAKAKVGDANLKTIIKYYTGEAITLNPIDSNETLADGVTRDLKVKIGNDTTLTCGEDYEIVEETYTNNINKGTATVVIKGINGYSGTKTVKFKINPQVIERIDFGDSVTNAIKGFVDSLFN